MKITAAIPHYNSLDTLWRLLSQLKEDTFDEIVVLDDASSIAPTKLEAEFPSVTFHYGDKNVGAGGNRNRILNVVKEGIVWFVDADMEIVSQKNAQQLRDIFATDVHQMVGGLIYTKSGQQMEWNYGHVMHPVHDARFEEMVAWLRAGGDGPAWERLQQRGWDYPWLQPGLKQPEKATYDWVAEGSFALPIELFSKVGGYDETLRYHEGQDLALRIRELKARVGIEPDIITRHLETHVRGPRVADEIYEARFLFLQKHWSITRAVFEQLYR